MSAVALNVPQTILVRVAGQEFSISRGTRVKAFLRRYLPALEPECLGATVANRTVDLEAPIASSCELIPLTYATKEGSRIYRSTLIVMLCEAIERLFPGARANVGQALGDGYYFDVVKEAPLTVADLDAIRAEMHAMVARKEAVASMRVPARQAIELFEAAGRTWTADIVRARRRAWVSLVTMGHAVDIAFNPILPTVENIRAFRVGPYADGLVLLLPPPGRPAEEPRPLQNHRAVFAVYRETRDWNRLVGVETVGDLNRSVIQGSIGEVIRVAEALHERRIASIADDVFSRKSRLVLVAGPSSSGKTTFVKRLRMQLLAIGVRPKELSVDNYYVDREKTPLDEKGEYDFECIEAIDLDLLNQHLAALMLGHEVAMPRYSFQRGRRDARTTPMRLERGEVLLMEGIHGLNDRLTAAVPDEQKTRIYVSALTQLCIDDHNRIFTSDSRLLRRIVRDRKFRGYSAVQTLRMWPKVRAGEERWIFPFQDRADRVFNSTLVYEQAALKVFAERYLMEVPEDEPAFAEAARLVEFLDLFVPVFADDVPATSILREFLGGSAFDY
ncbi:MAG: nucleoside kinase [Deltaproteobacteria bacterium]|nr:nucleoside kinase [Deltaproteobacteria bacterium]